MNLLKPKLAKNNNEMYLLNVTDEYLDDKGGKQKRAGMHDFESLNSRTINKITSLKCFNKSPNIEKWFNEASCEYEKGNYDKALGLFTLLLLEYPIFEPMIFYIIRICEKVLSVQLSAAEIEVLKQNRRWVSASWLQRLFFPKPKPVLRCKWCGRLTQYVDPNMPTFGFNTETNSCQNCGRMYPMPSFTWDSPDGRAYSYYRMSFSDDEFYNEFEEDYKPNPRSSKFIKNDNQKKECKQDAFF